MIRVRGLTPLHMLAGGRWRGDADRSPTGRGGHRSDAALARIFMRPTGRRCPHQSDAVRGRMLIRGLHFAGDAAMVAGMPLPEREHALEMCGRTPS